MRAEEINREKLLYDSYIHFENSGDKANIVIYGDCGPMMEALATILLKIEEETGLSRFTLLWDLQKMMKDIKRTTVFTEYAKTKEGDDE